MIRSTNPKIIGAFVTASIAILVLLILFFGSAKIFSQSFHYILFFDHSVNGLDVGSPVKLAQRDTVLLASDGLTDNMSIEEVVERAKRMAAEAA